VSGDTVVTYNPPVAIARSMNGASTAYVRLRRERISLNKLPDRTADAMRSAA
jgi:hypothetical protein